MKNNQKHQTFSIEIPSDEQKFKEFSDAMNDYQDEIVKYIQNLAKELNCSDDCAMDVYYLRTRSRHTPELEAELIKLHKAGTPPNMCDFG